MTEQEGSPTVTIAVLEREIFLIPEASRHLGIPDSTLRWWLDGGKRGGTRYPPVIRVKPTSSTSVTWGEFVEAGYLREYRHKDVPLQQLRPVIDRLREAFDIPYPLAHFRPFVGDGRRLVLQAQMISELPPDFWLVVGADADQILLTPSSEAFLERVEFAPKGERWAERIYPAGKDSPVVMDPGRSSGAPTVRGIRTEALAELVDAGEPIGEVAESFALGVGTLRAALAYEWSRQPAQQPAA